MWFQTGMPHQSGDEISDGGEGQVGSAPAVTLVVPSIMSELGLSSSGGKLAATANAPLVQVGNGRPSQLCMCTSPTGNVSDPIKSRLEQRVSVLLVANEQLLHSPLSPSATSRNPKIRFRQPSVDLEVSPSVSGASELSPDFPSSEAFSSSSEESESSPEASEERPISYTDLTSTIAQSCCSVAPMSIQNGGTKIVRYQHGEDSEAELMENFSGRRKSPESPESPEGRILDNGDLDEINDASDNTEMNKVGNVEEMPELDVPITHETCGSAPNEPKTPDKNDQTAVKENEVEEDNEDNMDSNEETVVKINENTEDTDDNKEGFAENEETDDVAVKANEEESGEDDRDNSKEQQEDDVAVVKENEETEEHGDRERTDEQISGEEESAVDVVTVVEINSNPKETRREESEDYQIIQDSPTGEREEVEIQDEIESTGEEHEGTEVQHSQEEAVMVEEEESMEKLNSAELFATEDHLVAHLTNESAIDEFLPHCHGVLTQSLTESEVKSLAIVASAPESRTGDNKPEEQRLLRTKSVEPTDSKKKKRGTTQSPSKRPLVPKPPEGQQARMSRRLRAVHSTNLGGQIELGENRSRAKSHSPAKGSTPKFLQDRPSLEAVERHKRKEEEKKTAEEQKLAEEKEKKRKEAEEAFKSWLRRKNEEIRRAKSTERDMSADVLTAEIKAKRKAEAEAAFQAWLERKSEEQREKKRFQTAISNATEKGPREEAEEAFRSWKDRKKLQPKLEGAKQRDYELIIPIGPHESQKAKRQKSTDGVVLPKIRNLRLVSPGGKKTSKTKSLPMINGMKKSD